MGKERSFLIFCTFPCGQPVGRALIRPRQEGEMKMGAKIIGVEPGGIAACHHIREGDTLLRINGHEILDVLDYRFYMVDGRLDVDLLDPQGQARRVRIDKDEYADIGLSFATYLMDQKRSCRNHCIFCFIDQLPPDMRESLYFKDDDARLSFLMGNYITLTNLSEREVQRIIDMHISPVNISVHTTNPELRAKVMGNRFAGRALDILYRLAKAGTGINCQLVLCRGVNDGAELDRTLRDLGALYPAVRSIAVVPVGLTRYREGLYPLEPYDRGSAREVVAQAEAFGAEFRKRAGDSLAYAADEFYIKAGLAIPPAAFYGEFRQLENGVGMTALLMDEFETARAASNIRSLSRPRKVSVATGVAVKPFIEKLAREAQKDIAQMNCMVYAINNVFFGENVNVSGLVTGGDLISQLSSQELGDELLIPATMLRREQDRFLDDVTPAQVERALGVRVVPVEVDGGELFHALIGETNG